jgi:hypothetical protein
MAPELTTPAGDPDQAKTSSGAAVGVTAPHQPDDGPQPRRRRTVIVLTAAVLTVILAVGWVAIGGSSNETRGAALRTVSAERRDLRSTGTADGTVRRRTELMVLAGSTSPSQVDPQANAASIGAAADSGQPAAEPSSVRSGSGSGSGAPGSVGAVGTGARATATTSTPSRTPTGSRVSSPTATPTPTPSSSGTPSPTPTATPSPTVSPTPTATPTPTPSSSGTLSPTPTAGPTPSPRPSPTGMPSPSPSGPFGPAPSTTRPTTPRVPAAPASPGAGVAPDGAAEVPSAAGGSDRVLTEVAAIGTPLRDGAVAYRLNGEAIVTMIDRTPSYRLLRQGDSGSDVLALERLLDRIGRADGITVDDEFDADTADAIATWEESLDRTDPDGIVEFGDLLVVGESFEVTGIVATVGDQVPAGTALLSVGSGGSDAVVDVPVGELSKWKVGGSARIEIAGTTTPGTIRSVSRDVVDGSAPVHVALGSVRPLLGTPLRVAVTGAPRENVIAVPVSAIVTGRVGTTVVRVMSGTGDAASEREVPVEVGLIVDGWAEVTGLEAVQQVRVPS